MHLLYFGRLRQEFGLSEETLTLPSNATVADLLILLRERGGIWAEELADGRIFRVAVDQEIALPNKPLQADSEVAIFPPVTGG